MENRPPQPGKIPPRQVASTKPLERMRQSVERIGEADQRSGGRVTARFAARDSRTRLSAAERKYQGRKIPSKPKYRISLLGGVVMVGGAGIVDLIGLIGTVLIELFGVPELIVEIV